MTTYNNTQLLSVSRRSIYELSVLSVYSRKVGLSRWTVDSPHI